MSKITAIVVGTHYKPVSILRKILEEKNKQDVINDLKSRSIKA